MALAASGCGDAGGAVPDAGACAQAAVLRGAYTTTTDTCAARAETSALVALSSGATRADWDAVQQGSGAATLAGAMLARLDASTGATPTSGTRFVAGLADAIAIGRAASGDDDRKAALEAVNKVVSVALAVALDQALVDAGASARRGDWSGSRNGWDRAAVYFDGMATEVGEYDTEFTIAGVWGSGHDRLATGAGIGATGTRRLLDGQTAARASATQSVVELAAETRRYVSRVWFLSTVKYGALIGADNAARRVPARAETTEGRYALEGLVFPVLSRVEPAVVSTARAHWSAASATMLDERTVLRDDAALYDELDAATVADFGALAPLDRFALVRALAGEVDALAEALTREGSDPVALSLSLDDAHAAIDAGDAATALGAIRRVRSAVAAIGTAP